MDFQIKIEKRIFERVEKLPLNLQAEFVFRVSSILGGLTNLSPTNVKLGSRNIFAFFIPAADDCLKQENGLVLKGFVRRKTNPKAKYNGTIYINGYHQLKKGKAVNKIGSNGAFEPEKKVGHYKSADFVTIGNQWFDAKYEDPKIQKQFETANFLATLEPVSYHSHIKALFYHDVDQVLAYAGHISKFDAVSPFSTLFRNKYEYYRLENNFDIVSQKKVSLYDLQQKHKDKDAIFFVNFIDEMDAFSYAQQDFTIILANGVQHMIPCSNIVVVDIITRQRNGINVLWEDFLEYGRTAEWTDFRDRYHCEPYPFSILMARLRDTYAISKLLDFDLFNGCRDEENPDQRNTMYRQNRDRIIHQVFSVAGLTTQYFEALIKDFTSLDQPEALRRVHELSQDTLTVCFNEKNVRAQELAYSLCNSMISLGYPFVSMAKAPIAEDKVNLIYNGQETTVGLENLGQKIITQYLLHILPNMPKGAKSTLDVSNYGSWH